MMSKLKQSQSQKQRISPRQILTSKLLQINRLAIEQRIYQEMEKNPFLDSVEQEEEDVNPDEQENTEEFDIEDFFPNYDDSFPASSTQKSTDMFTFVPNEKTQADSLFEQLRDYNLDETMHQIAEQIVYNLDKNGYFVMHPEVIAGNISTDKHLVLRVLKIIQKLDPPGIAARDLKECLLIQAKRAEKPQVYDFIKEHFDNFANRRFESIYEQGITKEQIQQYSDVISHFNPRPGEDSTNPATNQVLPDLLLEISSQRNKITTLSDKIPNLQINPVYLNMMQSLKKMDPNSKSFLKEKFISATQFIQSLAERKQTIVRVAEAIIKKQKKFIETDGKTIEPLTMSEIANDIEMDLSTVSRAVNGKFIQTPFGVFELRAFFTTHKIHENSEATNAMVKEQIKILVDSENSSHPHTDEKISKLLSKKSLKVARRTVAKYREILGILPSRFRRKL